LLCTAGTVVMCTPPTLAFAPKRTNCTCLGSPPATFSLWAKKLPISEPTTSFAFFATTILTVLEFGVTLTEKSGLAQLPAFASGWITSPR
jgi:hypothetical protein